MEATPPIGDGPEELIQRASCGDETAVEELLERYLPTARAYVRRRMGRLLRTREESLDVVQSACRRALERRDGYDHRSEPQFRAWLLGIVENKIVDRYRELNADRRSPDREVRLDSRESREDPALDVPATPASVAARNEERQRVRLALAHLPPELAAAVQLHELEGLSYERVAQRLGVTSKQARLRVVKAKVALARVLRDLESEATPDAAS